MKKKDWMDYFGNDYKDGHISDYPMDEEDYLSDEARDSEEGITYYAKIKDRLYEVPDHEFMNDMIRLGKTKLFKEIIL